MVGPVGDESRKSLISKLAASSGDSEQDTYLKYVEKALNMPKEADIQSSDSGQTILENFVFAIVGEPVVIIEPFFGCAYVKGELVPSVTIELDKIRDLHGKCSSYDWSNQEELNGLAAAIGMSLGSNWARAGVMRF